MATGDEAWVLKFREILAKTIIEHGSVISTDANFYGWGDYEATMHLRDGDWHGQAAPACPVAQHLQPSEDEWSEFEGTFVEHNVPRHGMQMTFTCKCGLLKDRTLRYEGNVAEMISSVITSAILPPTND